MNGYHKAEDRAKMIEAGLDPDAPPSKFELIAPYILGPIFLAILAFVFYKSLVG